VNSPEVLRFFLRYLQPVLHH